MTSQLRVDKIVPVDGAPTGGGGGIIQVVQTQKKDTHAMTATSYTDITNFNLTITPKFNTSKILIRGIMSVFQISSVDSVVTFRLLRGSTVIGSDSSDNRQGICVAYSGSTSTGHMGTVEFEFLDSPSTTSATTYKVQHCNDTSGQFNLNTWPSNDNYRGVSSLTAMEISA